MLIRSTAGACAKSGMPLSHAKCFQRIANETNCVIASRSVGIYATGLILEGYASKGFHVKSKSCDWGPMAGMVLSDPRFTKAGSGTYDLDSGKSSQRAENQKAIFKEGAAEVQVFISDERRNELVKMGCMERAGGNINEPIYAAKARGKDSKPMRFVLKREMNAPGANGRQLWSVWYANGETPLVSSVKTDTKSPPADGGLFPVMALTNPHTKADTYKAALTGDYDLWAVFPPANNAVLGKPTQAMAAAQFPTHGQTYGHQVSGRNIDQRPVVGSDRTAQPMSAYIKQEDPHMGNITPRIINIKNRLNAAICAAGYTGGDMVHHSDEVGRPKCTEVEMNYIAFIPNKTEARFIANMTAMNEFLKEVMLGYHITFNPGWQRQLGFSTSRGGSYEV